MRDTKAEPAGKFSRVAAAAAAAAKGRGDGSPLHLSPRAREPASFPGLRVTGIQIRDREGAKRETQWRAMVIASWDLQTHTARSGWLRAQEGWTVLSELL